MPTAEAPRDLGRSALSPKTTLRGPILIGLMILIIGVGGFFGWSFTAQLDSAAIAPGIVVVESRRKTIEHLEGGILEAILVKEGDEVSEGQMLMTLSEIQARSELSQVEAQYRTNLAQFARLIAERDRLEQVTFAKDLLADAQTDPAVARVVTTQEALFERRRRVLQGQDAVYREQIEQVGREITGLESRLGADRESLELLQREIAGVETLVSQGYAPETRLLALKREQANLRGNIGDLEAQVAQSRLRIAETELERLNTEEEFTSEVVTELQDVEKNLQELEGQLSAARDVVNRVHIRAPQDGVVVGLTVHTEGEVVQGGETLLEIVPASDRLLIEALVRPEDIDVVHAGMDAQIRLSAYSFRSTPPVAGMVRTVSADRVKDEASGTSAYLAMIEVAEEDLANLQDVRLYPGMPAEVMVRTGQRTAMDYMITPILRSFERGMREQ